MAKQISTAALKRIITAQKQRGSFNSWNLNFSKLQAETAGLTKEQIESAFQEFQAFNKGVTKWEMIDIVYAAICAA
jgi:hypothetical protein